MQRELSDQTKLMNLPQIRPDRWWFSRDSLFLNQAKPGLNFGCRCNQPAKSNVVADKSRPNAPAYKIRRLIAYQLYTTSDKHLKLQC